MRLLAINVCKQLRYRLSNEVNRTIIRRFNSAMFEEQPDQKIQSKLFPDYHVVYVYPSIHIAYLCNKIKRNYTVASIACIPVSVTLQMLGYMSLSTCIGFTILGNETEDILLKTLEKLYNFCIPISYLIFIIYLVSFTLGIGAFALPVHTLCYYWNNTVGSIYFKDEDSKVIISYVNYWGNRVDLSVEKEKILPFMEVPYNTSKSSFMRLKIDTVKPTLKVFLKKQYIYRAPIFHNIFGDVK